MWKVKASIDFWKTVAPFKEKYSKAEYIFIIKIIREAILELQEKGHVEYAGLSDHQLTKYPYNDGNRFEFHIHDDDVLVVYFKRESKRVIRMVGVYSHESI